MVKCVDVYLRPSYAMFWLLCILTLGIYWIILKTCACCVPRRMDVDRGKVVVTSKGRIGLWKSVIAGTTVGCTRCCGSRLVTSKTSIQWNNVKMLTSVQLSYGRRARCFGLCKPKVATSLRLFFNLYPDNDGTGDLNSAASIPVAMQVSTSSPRSALNYSVVSKAFCDHMANAEVGVVVAAIKDTIGMIRQLIEDQAGSAKRLLKWLAKLAFAKIKEILARRHAGAGVEAAPTHLFGDAMELALFSTHRDHFHMDDTTCLKDFVHLQYVILQMKSPNNPVRLRSPRAMSTVGSGKAADADAATFKLVSQHCPLFPVKFYNSNVPVVSVDTSLLPLFEGEEIIDVLPQVSTRPCLLFACFLPAQCVFPAAAVSSFSRRFQRGATRWCV